MKFSLYFPLYFINRNGVQVPFKGGRGFYKRMLSLKMKLLNGREVSVGEILRKVHWEKHIETGRLMKPLLKVLSEIPKKSVLFEPQYDLFALPKDFKDGSVLLEIANKIKEEWPEGFAPVYKTVLYPFHVVARELNKGKKPYPIWQNANTLMKAKIVFAIISEMARSSNGMLIGGRHYILVKPDDSIQFIPMNQMIDGKTEFAKIVGNGKLYIFPADVKSTGYELPLKWRYGACKLDLNLLAFLYAVYMGIDIPFFEKRTYTSIKHVDFGKIPCQRCGSGQELNGILSERSLVKIILEFCPLREIPEVLDNELIPYCNQCCRDMVIETSPKQFNHQLIDFNRDFKLVASRLLEVLKRFPIDVLAKVLDELYVIEAFQFAKMAQIRQQECRNQYMESYCSLCGDRCGYYDLESKLQVLVRMDLKCTKLIIDKMVACQIANCEAKQECFNKTLTASTEALIVAPMVATMVTTMVTTMVATATDN